jgi:hypothetical protein
VAAPQRFERSGLLILRVQLLNGERSDSTPRLAATITMTLDLARREEQQTTAGSVEEICAVVRCWIEAFVNEAAR